MKGIGPATLAKFRALVERGGWMPAGEYFETFGYRGNRLPSLVVWGFVEVFGFNFLSDRDAPRHAPSYYRADFGSEPITETRVGYRLTDAGRELLAEQGGRD